MKTPISFLFLFLFLFPHSPFAQTPDLGTASSFAVFTAVGAFDNQGTSVITGDIGTNVGAFNGFPPGIVIGTIHVADPASTQAATDVMDLYSYLSSLTCGQVLSTTLGNGQNLTPDIYCLGAASTLDGSIVLDGEGDPNSIFIFQIDGALSTSTHAHVVLTGSASLCNVYWQINGAFTLGDSSSFAGTIVANGAIHLLQASSLEGRALSQMGAIDLHNNIVNVSLPPVAAVITADGPVALCAGESLNLSGNIDGIWNTGASTSSIDISLAGDYYVINTTACGSDTSNHILVTVNALPDCTITGDASFCTGQSATICTTDDASFYEWSTGENSGCIDVSIAGTYFVTVTDANGCSNTCSFNVSENNSIACTIVGDLSICQGESTTLCTPPGSASYTWDNGDDTNCTVASTAGNYAVTITESNGCTSTCSVTVTVTLPPPCTITGASSFCAGETSTLCTVDGAVAYAWSNGAVANCITISDAGTYTVTVTDANGCTSSCDFTATVNPIPNCSITGSTTICEGQSTVLCTASGFTNYLWSTGGISNCITVNAPGNYVVTVTDANGCTSSCNITVTTTEGSLPMISCPANITIQCNAITLPSNTGNASATGDCNSTPTISYIDDTAPGNCPQTFIITRTWTATDVSGNTASCNQTISVTDNLPPNISCPSNITVQCAGQVPAAIPTDIVTSDNCGGGATVTFLGDVTTNQTCANQFTVNRTYQAIDGCGNSATCVQTITVFDNLAPSITCPANITVQCAGQIPIANPTSVVTSDNCGGVATVTFLGDVTTNQTCANQFTVNRTYQAIDGCGNTASCVQTITVFDNLPPSITCPANITVQCAGQIPAAIPASVVASDNCGGGATVTFLGDVTTNQICANQFTVNRTYQAIDGCGNSATCVQTITVFDNLPPSITCPANITVQCAGQIPIAIPTSVVTSDNCGGGATVTFLGDVTTNQTCANQFTVNRTYQAIDGCGNSATCIQTITVFDNLPPSITCPANITVQCAGQIPAAIPTSIVTSDNCGGGATVTFLGDVTTNQTCANQFTVNRTYQAIDGCGNSATCIQTITVFDNLPPSITCPANITVQCAGQIPAAIPTSVVTSDNCGGGATVTFLGDVTTNQTCANQFTVNRTYQAIDGCGNSATCIQTITVFDDLAPSITCPANITVQCTGEIPVANPATVVASDNCGGVATVAFLGDVTTNQTCANQFTVNRTYQAIDGCGNSATCVQTITVFDNLPPSITCPANITVQCAGQIPAAIPTSIVTSDNCGGGATVTFLGDVTTNQTCANQFTVNRTYQAIDGCGNSATCIQTITVFDNLPPSITCPVNITVQCAGQIPAAIPTSIVTSDNCGGGTTVTFLGDVTTNQTCANQFTVNRTYQAIDGCGNSATCIQTITVFDNLPPSITCPANITVQCAGQIPAAIPTSIVTSDNCGGGATVVLVGDVISNQVCANHFTMSRTYSATDACGNISLCTQIFTILDNIPPIIICPMPITVQCADQIPTPNTAGIVSNDNCGTTTVTFLSDVISNQVCTNNFTVTRTYQSTDLCGNSATCSQVIRVLDTTAPIITFVNLPFVNGQTFDVQCYGQDPTWDLPVYNAGSIIATDNCNGPVTVTYQQTLESEGNCQSEGYINLYRLTWTATDNCGNIGSAFVFLALVDTIVPVLHGIPDDVIVNCNEIPAVPASVYATDECLCACVITFEETQPIAGCLNDHVIVRTWAARDRCGNVSVEQQHITLKSNTGPTLHLLPQPLIHTVNGDILKYTCTGGGIPKYFNELSEASVTNNSQCGDAVEINFSVNTTISTNCDFFGYIEQRIYQWVGTDDCGNSTLMKLTVHLIDDEAPVLLGVPTLACISDPSLEAIEAVDNCGNAKVSFWDVPVPNPCGEGIAFRRTYEASDDCGNITRDTVMLIPNDQTQPTMELVKPGYSIDFPSQLTLQVNCDFNGSQYTNFSAQDVHFTDGCSEGVTIGFMENIISINDCTESGNIAQLELLWTATDVCGNLSELSQLVNIVDNSGPVFENFVASITIGCQDTLPAVYASDNCNVVSLTTVDKIIPGDCENEYTIERTIRASDPCGNTTIQIQTVHVGDGSGPVIEGVVTELCEDLTMPFVTAFDNCSGTFVDVVMIQDTLPGCSDEIIIRRMWRASDACGNTSEKVQFILQNDHKPPVILIPSYSVLQEWAGNQMNQISLSATKLIKKLAELNANSIFLQDGCDQTLVPVFSVLVTPLDCSITGFIEHRTYTWIAKDACANADTFSFGINIIDDIPPVFIISPGDVTVTCAPLPPAALMQVYDLSLPTVVTYSESVIEITPGVFNVVRTWKAVDRCGNQSSFNQRIHWIPNTLLDCEILIPNGVECNSHGVAIEIACTATDDLLTYTWEIAGEKCFIQSGQGTPGILIYVGFSGLNISVTVTDPFGCQSVSYAELDCVETYDNNFGGPGTTENSLGEILQHTTTASNVSVEEKVMLKNLSLWPNPAVDKVNLSFESDRIQQIKVNLYNQFGQWVYAENFITEIGTNSQLIEIAHLPAGTYLVQVMSALEVQSKLFMLQPLKY